MQQNPHMHPVSRRTFFALGAAVALAACSGDDTTPASTAPADGEPSTTSPGDPASTSTSPPTTIDTGPELADDPFILGVSSGDPDATSVVLWTRLVAASDPLPDEVPVVWELSEDESFASIVATGTAIAKAAHGHSVHAVAELDRPLLYRFRSGGHTSPTGRCRPAGPTDELRIASASCQHFETGFYAAYRDMAEWGPDLVLHLGDFIYEYGGGAEVAEGRVRTHGSPEIVTLDDYRDRYALYLGDADLRSARAACPWAVIWDDHEVENNYAGIIPEKPEEAADFPARRAAAYQAWWEHMPVRMDAPVDGALTIHRRIDWGDLATIVLIDGRQYRSDQACGDAVLDFSPPCDEVADESRSMLGDDQEDWFAEQMRAASGTWTVIGQQTVMSSLSPGGGAILNYDQWDGYPAARRRLFDAVRSAERDPVVVITGDIHLAGVGRLVDDDGTAVGTEFVTTSISSRANVPEGSESLLALFPDVLAIEAQHRGYTRHTIRRDAWEADFRIVDDVLRADSTVGSWQRFVLERGATEPVASEP
jgi:alkaline phosphatase D